MEMRGIVAAGNAIMEDTKDQRRKRMGEKEGPAPWAIDSARELLTPDLLQNPAELMAAVAAALDEAYERGLEQGLLLGQT